MPKFQYSISEVAEMLEVNQSLLRFWEKEFDQLSPHKNSKGTRFYQEEDIALLKDIYYLVKEQRLTLAGAQKRLKENRSSVSKQQELHRRLVFVKENLVAIKKGITLPSGEDEK